MYGWHKILLVIATSLYSACPVHGQLYLGITGDFGNRVVNDAKRESLFKKPSAPSGSISFVVNEKIRNEWFLQYGGGLGSLGYTIKPAEADTLLNDPGFYDPYPNYNTVYVNGHLGFGRQFFIKQMPLFLFGGGGVTSYLDILDSQPANSSGVWDGSSFQTVFEYETHLKDTKIKGFVDFSLQVALTSRLLVGIRYRYHFKSAIAGTYAFYHMKEPSSGSLSVTQRAASILFLFKIGKKASM